MTGDTTSVDFPTLSPFQGKLAGSSDAFVTKLNATGTALGFSTYFGGNDLEQPYGIAHDSAGNLYIAGITASTNLPLASAYQSTNKGPSSTAPGDAFLT